ncbi:hypothetical protein H072_5392 [Dactylellina haptotyla CBS 200.50]|uniref:Uncharacterized protein n=1 Tax=Dactylellina haptotyla (strain CBS 200.50) TaxID=1284197 RepID=S8BMJ7_DACHA|nr:hypothetical protein H072_5392 [Dactylellina haptotyla CBS 200.50]
MRPTARAKSLLRWRATASALSSDGSSFCRRQSLSRQVVALQHNPASKCNALHTRVAIRPSAAGLTRSTLHRPFPVTARAYLSDSRDIDNVCKNNRDEAQLSPKEHYRTLLCGLKDPLEKAVIRRMLHLLCFCPRQPFRNELEAYLLITVGNCTIEEIRTILQASRERDLIYFGQDEIVFLSHEFSRDILVRSSEELANHPSLAYFLTDPGLAHAEIARSLIKYLCDPELARQGPCKLPKEWKKRRHDYPLLVYAAINWSAHCRNARTHRASLANLASPLWATGMDSTRGVWAQASYLDHGREFNTRLTGDIYSYVEKLDHPSLKIFASGLLEFAPSGIMNMDDKTNKMLSLWGAITDHQESTVDSLLRSGADIKESLLNSRTALFYTGPSFNKERLSDLLSLPGMSAIVNEINDQGETLLHTAVSDFNPQAIIGLIESGATLDVYSRMGRTPLHAAASEFELRPVEVLLQGGANPNGLLHLQSPLHAVCSDKFLPGQIGRPEIDKLAITQKLIEAGANLVSLDADGFTPLTLAAMNDHRLVVEKLLSHYSTDEINTVGRWGTGELATALTAAVIYGARLETVELLINRGATGVPGRPLVPLRQLLENLNNAESYRILKYFCERFPQAVAEYSACGESMIHTALSGFPPRPAAMNYLLSLPGQRESIFENYESYEESTLQWTARGGYLDVMVEFAQRSGEHDKKLPWKDIWNDARALENSNGEEIERFLEYRKEFNSPENMIDALYNVLNDGRGSERAALFYMEKLEKDFKLSLRDSKHATSGNTILHYACENGYHNLFNRLMTSHKPDVNARNNVGLTPLMVCFDDYPTENIANKVVHTLLKNGADTIIQDTHGGTALSHAAASIEWLEPSSATNPIQLLLDHPGTRETMDVSDKSGLRPIDHACLNNMYGATRVLMAEGAQLRTKDDNEEDILPRMRLHGYLKNRNYPLIDELIKMGADVNAVNSYGENLFYRAVESGSAELVRKLVQVYKVDLTAPLPDSRLPYLDGCIYCPAQFHVLLKLATPEQRQKIVHGRSLDGKGETALHVFTKNHAVAAVRWLIEAGADVNAVDAKGRTPLFFANRRGSGLTVAEGAHSESVTSAYYLLEAGADAKYRNPQTGQTVFEHITKDNWFDMKKAALGLLKKYGALDDIELPTKRDEHEDAK